MISERATVRTSEVGRGVVVGDFAVVEEGVVLGDGVVVHPLAVIRTGAVLAAGVEVFPGALIGREPKGAGATARPISFRRHLYIGEHTQIGPHAIIYYDTRIGASTLIGDGASIREGCVVGDRCIIARYVTLNYHVTVGDRTKIMDLSHITGNTKIGEDVFISTLVATTNDNALGAKGYDEEGIKGPTICRGVMVGAGANILPRVVVGEGAIVGAGAVVTGDVPPHKLVTGIPARVVRDV